MMWKSTDPSSDRLFFFCCEKGQSAVEYLVICACLVTALLAAPPLFDTVHDTMANKYRSYSFGVAISDPPTVAFDQKIQEIIDTLKKWGEKVLSWLQNFFKKLKDFFTKGIPNFFKSLLAELRKLWDSLKDPKKLFKLIGDTIKNVFSMLWDAIKGIGQKIWDIIKGIAKGIWDGIKSAAKIIWDVITHPWKTIKELFKGFLKIGGKLLKWFCGG